ncbi:hypothetical protein N9N67_02010 [Bacteriovoracaceae bacterium]|nr:hypothetical protein [Bacteriovoracaceae bacterium]
MNSPFLKCTAKLSLFTLIVIFNLKAEKEFQEKYPNGQIKTSGNFSNNNKMTGVWKRFREDGSLISEGKWKENQPIGFWKHSSASGEIEQFGNYSCEQKVGLWKEGKKWYFYRPKKRCLSYWLSFLRMGATYNHQNSREYSYSFNVSWNPEIYNYQQFIFGLGLGTDFLKEQEETVDNERVGKNQTYASFFLELQFKYVFTKLSPNNIEFFFGIQDFSESNSETASIFGLRYFIHNKVFFPQIIDKFFLGYKRVSSSDLTFDQVAAGIKLNF